jgi:hypothetical protein
VDFNIMETPSEGSLPKPRTSDIDQMEDIDMPALPSPTDGSSMSLEELFSFSNPSLHERIYPLSTEPPLSHIWNFQTTGPSK